MKGAGPGEEKSRTTASPSDGRFILQILDLGNPLDPLRNAFAREVLRLQKRFLLLLGQAGPIYLFFWLNQHVAVIKYNAFERHVH